MAEEKPAKGQKVEGRILLDLRAKINDLERQLSRSVKDLRKFKDELSDTKKKLTGR